MIDLVNEKFVVTDINLTDKGFPAALPGLRPIQRVYEHHKQVFCDGFATCVVLTPDGKDLLADAGNVFDIRTYCGFYPEQFLEFLQEAIKQSTCDRGVSTKRPAVRSFWSYCPPG